MLWAAQSAAQPTNQPTGLTGNVTNIWGDVISFLQGGSNWFVVPFGTLWDHKVNGKSETDFGGGIALGYKVSEYFAPVMRLDYLAGDLWLPSGTIQLQVPIHLGKKFTVYPFAFGGVGTAISGDGKNNGEANAIYGMGVAIVLSKKVDIVADWEQWSELPGDQWRLGVLIKF